MLGPYPLRGSTQMWFRSKCNTRRKRLTVTNTLRINYDLKKFYSSGPRSTLSCYKRLICYSCFLGGPHSLQQRPKGSFTLATKTVVFRGIMLYFELLRGFTQSRRLPVVTVKYKFFFRMISWGEGKTTYRLSAHFHSIYLIR